jgi:hypothetical protein
MMGGGQRGVWMWSDNVVQVLSSVSVSTASQATAQLSNIVEILRAISPTMSHD